MKPPVQQRPIYNSISYEEQEQQQQQIQQ